MRIEELRIKQAEFEGIRQEHQKEWTKLEKEREEFVTDLFPKKRLYRLAPEEYAIGGEKSSSSFCYWIENRLKGLGDIHGANAFKFGLYFGKIKSDSTRKYRFTTRFGDNETDAFNNIKKALLSLLIDAQQSNLAGIKDNPLSPMFKGKILATYYPDRYLNIFSKEHLEYFLDKLGVHFEDNSDDLQERQLLIDFKNKDSVMSKWTIHEFSSFLYHAFGRPSNKAAAPKELEEYLESRKEYPRIKSVRAEFIELAIRPSKASISAQKNKTPHKTIDFEKENLAHKLLGNRGEEIVLSLEKESLINLGKNDLAGKVCWSSKEDDSLGYDIVSYEDNGTVKHIEVKSTNQPPGSNVSFLISSNQYSKGKTIPNYYFYVVFNARSNKPKVWKIKNPFDYENKGLFLTPVSYRVNIDTSTS